MKVLTIACALFLFGAMTASGQFLEIERRQEQFPTEPAHLIVPLPYDYPGIGSGIAFLASVSNAFDTTWDTYLTYVTGEVEGYLFIMDEIPLIQERLHLYIYLDDISKASRQNYKIRGMGTKKEDFDIVELDSLKEWEATLTLSMWDRLAEFFYTVRREKAYIKALRDNEGNLVSQFPEPIEDRHKHSAIGARLDYTDDYQDPRKGIRSDFRRVDIPSKSSVSSKTHIQDINILGFVPIGAISTLVFNHYRSDAVVDRAGESDPTAIAQEHGLGCDPAIEGDCLPTQEAYVDNIANERQRGGASKLGGPDRLRSYPEGRFGAAHMEFLGVEFRYNISTKVRPFDFFIWKDVQTGLQTAFFYETGTVAETPGALWDESRSSYGIGGRLITASGAVYRFDYATGDEGAETTLFIRYPWR